MYVYVVETDYSGFVCGKTDDSVQSFPLAFPHNAMCPVQVNNHDELATEVVGQDDHIFVSSVDKLNVGA